jgi:hypothetical protein
MSTVDPALVAAERDFLLARMFAQPSHEYVGISSNALVEVAFHGGQTVERPRDESDLGRCENTFAMMPAHLQQRVKPLLQTWRADITKVAADRAARRTAAKADEIARHDGFVKGAKVEVLLSDWLVRTLSSEGATDLALSVAQLIKDGKAIVEAQLAEDYEYGLSQLYIICPALFGDDQPEVMEIVALALPQPAAAV